LLISHAVTQGKQAVGICRLRQDVVRQGFHEFFTVVVLSIVINSTAVLSQNISVLFANLNPTGAGCVNPDGFLSCYDTNNKTAATGAAHCNSQDCYIACSLTLLAGYWLSLKVLAESKP
jgi:hypothetical protein